MVRIPLGKADVMIAADLAVGAGPGVLERNGAAQDDAGAEPHVSVDADPIASDHRRYAGRESGIEIGHILVERRI